MAQSTTPRLRSQISRLRHRAAAQPELGLDTLLPEATVQQVLTEEGAKWKRVFYTPWLTFWAFFWQVLSPDRSCRAAVKRIAAWRGRRAGLRGTVYEQAGRNLDAGKENRGGHPGDSGSSCPAKAGHPVNFGRSSI